MSVEAPLVLVTGVSGFIASWVAHGALKLGYRVRGTVRSLSNENKVKHLRDLYPGSKYSIELVEADLMNSESWTKAVEGCDYILHVASPFPLDEPKDPQEVIQPAVEGTLNVLKAASELAKPPKRVIVTSSFYAIGYGVDPRNKVFTDADWTNPENKAYPINSYGKSKVFAERAAWDFVEKLPADKKFELATVNPGLVQGPMLSGSSCSSAEIVTQITTAKMPAIPDVWIPYVSVLEVARAHLLAMTVPEAAGKRFLVINDTMSFKQMSETLVAELGPKGYKPVTFTAPNWLLSVMAFFGDKQAKDIVPLLGIKQQCDPVNCKTVLNMKGLTPQPSLIADMAYAAINAGIMPDRSEGSSITKNYVVPELDVSDIAKP
mmetsp:Transcript_22434/g.37523  ORF Transcript_22434/g.37523 Transcript_22434/m.37523 type:complete len:377 (-) Transcript_22434:362-1492(-)|eukprot:CAMPEP_0174961122 /NCGR_PEP_ID=MMETSP0004_2-20121128/4069_1 /TAXON_ID=420556 /ORGANISM="Ochromonas sp., Strain CCMP1393" /LENGTH=376 /DNA_ID=CAMNT_0016209541 /DNA_START=32 /DNA_END=1162 /DNA_ORIENTATION=+